MNRTQTYHAVQDSLDRTEDDGLEEVIRAASDPRWPEEQQRAARTLAAFAAAGRTNRGPRKPAGGRNRGPA